MPYAPSQKRKISKRESKEVNVIPIMNLFLVVIPMLMTMMVSIHLGMIGINYSASQQAGAGKEEQEQETEEKTEIIQLKIMSDKFEFLIGKDTTEEIPVIEDNQENKFDFVALDKFVKDLKTEFKEQNTILIFTEPEILYGDLIRTIDICKFNGFPNIKYLSTRRRYLKKN